jgi:hypothetical protein
MNHKTTEVYFLFWGILTVSRDVGIQQSERWGKFPICALGDLCKEIAATRSLNHTEFHLKVLEKDILDQDLEPFIDDTPGSDDTV